MTTQNFICYVIATQDKNFTYCGITNNPTRRLRQHRGELTGGAAYTAKHVGWRYAYQIKGFTTRREALSFEYQLKKETSKNRGTPIEKRRLAIFNLLAKDRWTNLRSEKIEMNANA